MVRLRSNGIRSLRRSCVAWSRRRRLGAASGSRWTSLRLRRTRWSSAPSPGARSCWRRARTPFLLSSGLRQSAWRAGCVTGSCPSPSRRAQFGPASSRSLREPGASEPRCSLRPVGSMVAHSRHSHPPRTRPTRASASRLRLVSCPLPSPSAARSGWPSLLPSSVPGLCVTRRSLRPARLPIRAARAPRPIAPTTHMTAVGSRRRWRPLASPCAPRPAPLSCHHSLSSLLSARRTRAPAHGSALLRVGRRNFAVGCEPIIPADKPWTPPVGRWVPSAPRRVNLFRRPYQAQVWDGGSPPRLGPRAGPGGRRCLRRDRRDFWARALDRQGRSRPRPAGPTAVSRPRPCRRWGGRGRDSAGAGPAFSIQYSPWPMRVAQVPTPTAVGRPPEAGVRARRRRGCCAIKIANTPRRVLSLSSRRGTARS